MEEDEYGEPVPIGDDRPDDGNPNEAFIDRSNEEFEQEIAEKLSLDLRRPSRSRQRKDRDPEEESELADLFGDFDSDEGNEFVVEEGESTFWLSTYRTNTAFMQVCHHSDRMSAVFGTNLENDVSVPLLLDENFSYEDAEKAFSDIQTVTPTCLWISTSDKSCVDNSAWLMTASANWQIANDKYFVLAINFKSSVWEQPCMTELLSKPYVFHTTVNMRSFEKRKDNRRRLTMCLVHNILGNYVNYLGSARTNKETCPDKSKLVWFSDDH